LTKPEAYKTDSTPVFENLSLRIWRQTYYSDQSAFHAQVRQSPLPLQGGSFQADLQPHLAEFRELFEQHIKLERHFYDYTTVPSQTEPVRQQAAQKVSQLGRKLYELLPLTLQEGVPRILQRVFERGHGLRLILEAQAGDQADQLLSLPWELLFFADTRVYPVRSPRLLVVRQLLGAARQNQPHLAPPLNLIHVIADSPAKPINAELQAMEQQTLSRVVAPGTYTLVAKPGSVEGLLDAMQHQSAQIIHFLGHGEQIEKFNTEQALGARGYLRFVSAAGQQQWVTGEQLQHLLGETPGVQLIVLGACYGGAITASNIALDLVYSGFPYVVAMQSAMSQAAAQHFIQAFYAELQKERNLEYAVAAGRFAIAAHLPGAIDWCLPVLYTNAGLPEQPRITQAADKARVWWSQKRFFQINLALGIIHLIVGVLLYISRASPLLPDQQFIAWIAMGWCLIPLFVVAGALLFKQATLPTKVADWPRSTQWALWMRLWISATIGFGLVAIYFGFGLVLLAGLGFWGLLSPLAQWLIVGAASGAGILNSYSQVRSHGQGFTTDNQVKRIFFKWDELTVLAGAYTILLILLGVLYFIPFLLTPPLGNLIIGGLCLTLAYGTRQEN
jgi:hypothetical protein